MCNDALVKHGIRHASIVYNETHDVFLTQKNAMTDKALEAWKQKYPQEVATAAIKENLGDYLAQRLQAAHPHGQQGEETTTALALIEQGQAERADDEGATACFGKRRVPLRTC
eukprot:7313515-Pyramimonas_sp.AAC.1